ncbi:DUF6059 family protein [Asanoa iriomotensis]|uniref:Uncharacterized protein n=1 Tax=Asanoa iriomotensis TaxID=234613 RepID=A0ABQ4C0Y5_9ACTN|nr:DUF6059 family protein [Asanoa iriomotensis]GIF56443.1 hypothetical protein Air01nite_25380 [Asanoa iriomotensis]
MSPSSVGRLLRQCVRGLGSWIMSGLTLAGSIYYALPPQDTSPPYHPELLPSESPASPEELRMWALLYHGTEDPTRRQP